MADERSDSPDGDFPTEVFRLARRFLSRRYLRGLSADERDRLREQLEVVRRTLLQQRAPRIAVVGSRERPLAGVLASFAGEAVPAEIEVKEQLGRGRWYDYELRGIPMEVLDLRRRAGEEPSMKALDRDRPDLIFLDWNVRDVQETEGEPPEDGAAIRDLEAILERIRTPELDPPGLLALVDADFSPEEVNPARARRILREKLREADVRWSRTRVLSRDDVRRIDREMVEMAPLEARFALARAVETPGSKRELARMIIRASAGIAAAIATVPLPVADLLPITGVQMAMVAAIGQLSGRKLSIRTVGEFTAAMGLNVGAGYAGREIARALVQFVPFAGPVISSSIAAGATFTVGNAAARYFLGGDGEEFEAAEPAPAPKSESEEE